MPRLLLPLAMLAACTPAPRKADMPKSTMIPTSTASDPGKTDGQARAPAVQAAQQAIQGPIPEPVSAAGVLAHPREADRPEAAQGRRTLSTAFVRVGPDGHLTVELKSGQVLVLRDVIMGAGDYCGIRVGNGSGDARYCGGYAEIAAARPGGAPTTSPPDPAGDMRATPMPSR